MVAGTNPVWIIEGLGAKEVRRVNDVGYQVPIGADGFVYDGASRLVKGELLVGGVTKKDQFTYDGYGNLTNIRRTIGAASPEDRALPADTATNRLSVGTYDHAGNQTALTATFAPNQTYTYDPLDQMRARTVTGSRSFVYLYDADGERIAVDETTTGTTRMLTLRGLDGKVLRELRDSGAGWAWSKDYVYRGGTLLASVSVDGGIRHYHLDHLSTPRLHTDRCGAIAAELKSFPYGESATEATGPQNPERMRFTMHERDLGDLASLTDDLDYMHARCYGAYQGRFLNVDPGRDATPTTTRSWNFFSYVRGNPAKAVDPTGRANDWAYGPFSSDSTTPFQQMTPAPPQTPEQNAVDSVLGGLAAVAAVGPVVVVSASVAVWTAPVAVSIALNPEFLLPASSFLAGLAGNTAPEGLLPSQARHIRVIANQVENHLTPRDLAYAWLEMKGIRDGTGHVNEVALAGRTIAKHVKQLQAGLHPNNSQSQAVKSYLLSIIEEAGRLYRLTEPMQKAANAR